MSIVYKMDYSSQDYNTLNRKESVYDNEKQTAVSIMDFITINL